MHSNASKFILLTIFRFEWEAIYVYVVVVVVSCSPDRTINYAAGIVTNASFSFRAPPNQPFDAPLKFDIFCEHLLRVFSTRVIDVLRLCAQCVGHRNALSSHRHAHDETVLDFHEMKKEKKKHATFRAAPHSYVWVHRCNRRLKVSNW